MKTFREFLQMREGGMWMNPPIQDNPSNPGTKRKDAKDPYNHRFGSAQASGSFGMPNMNMPQQPMVQTPMPQKKMKKK